MSKIYGVTNLEFRMNPNETPTVRLELAVGEGFSPYVLYNFDRWDDYFPGDVLVRCQWCGQWGARKCTCPKCGGAIE